MIHSLKLGNSIFPNNIIQGPLAGVSSAPFRVLTAHHSQPAYTCTEMISAKTLIHKSLQLQRRYLTKYPNEGPVCFQLASNNPKDLAEAVKIATAEGADLIDLNCGCPVKKMRKKGVGSRLLSDPQQLSELIYTMRENTHVPISIKIRVDGNSLDHYNHEILQVIQESALDYLIVHGRHWTEDYTTPCHYQHIEYFAKNLKIPVIGNGDIRCLSSLTAMFATGCAGVMISRAGVGQPWLIAKLIAEAAGMAFKAPSVKEIGRMYLEHIANLSDLLQNETLAILEARKFAKYYARALPDKLLFCEAVMQCRTFAALQQSVEQFF